MVYKRRKYHYGDTHLKRRWRTKRRTKDLDQVPIITSNLFLLHNIFNLIEAFYNIRLYNNSSHFC